MHKKKLILLFTLTCVNSSFIFGDNKPMPSLLKINLEYLENLKHFDPKTKNRLLILKNEHDHLQNQERKYNSTSKNGVIIAIVSFLGAGIAECCLNEKGKGQNWLGGISIFGLVGGMAITFFGSNESINLHKEKEQVRKEMETIIKDAVVGNSNK